jgi:membrane protein YqaA with SNARE-associated domain
MSWSRHPQADKYLAILSFAESSFFPVPPDVMLMPMSLAKPNMAMRYAWITTIFSLLGGLLGYAIGYFAFESLWPWLVELGYQAKIERVQHFFDVYGVWIVFAAGFSPIPYKLFTITAGAAQMALLPFIVASFFGRGLRFFLVAYLMKIGGEKYEARIRQSVDWMGWGVVGLILLYGIYKYTTS